MSAPIPTIEPTSFVKGSTVKWARFLNDFRPQDGWVLSYAFRNQTNAGFDVACTASGTNFLATITAANSLLLTAGDYDWQSYVTNGSERYDIGRQRTTVLEDLAAQTGAFDSRSQARIILDYLMAHMAGRAPDGINSHSLGGVPISLIPLEQLPQLINFWKRQVVMEEQAAKLAQGLNTGRNIYVRFGPQAGQWPPGSGGPTGP